MNMIQITTILRRPKGSYGPKLRSVLTFRSWLFKLLTVNMQGGGGGGGGEGVLGVTSVFET